MNEWMNELMNERMNMWMNNNYNWKKKSEGETGELNEDWKKEKKK